MYLLCAGILCSLKTLVVVMYKFAISQGWLFLSANISSLVAFSVCCRTEFDISQAALKLSSWDFFQEHAEVWRETWKNGLLEVMLLGQLIDQLSK